MAPTCVVFGFPVTLVSFHRPFLPQLWPVCWDRARAGHARLGKANHRSRSLGPNIQRWPNPLFITGDSMRSRWEFWERPQLPSAGLGC